MKGPSLTEQQKTIVRRDYPTKGARAVAEQLGVAKYMVKNYVHHAGLKKDPAHVLNKRFTPEQQTLIERLYADNPTAAIASQVGRTCYSVNRFANKLGLRKSEAFLNSEASGRLREGSTLGLSTRLKKGNVPWSKGKKMPDHVKAKTAGTWFKKGQLPYNTKTDGTISVRRDAGGREYYWIRLALGKWQHLHRYLWEKEKGPVPDGYVVTFKDGNRMRCVIENLECITEAERLARTSVHTLPPELKSTVMAKGVLRRMINKRTKDHEQEQAHQ